MKELIPLSKNKFLQGEITVPPDKSIAQRAVILAALAEGQTIIHNFPSAGDPQSTLQAISQLGIEVQKINTTLKINSAGASNLQEPTDILYFGNSGTGLRLSMGFLAGLPQMGFVCLNGDASLRQRPMARIIKPLEELGAKIEGRAAGTKAPLSLKGQNLHGGQVIMKVASAQLKSALLLAGLQANTDLILHEPSSSRNHTEIMLKEFGAQIEQIAPLQIKLKPGSLKSTEITIPGDLSSAAFLLVAATIVPESRLTIHNIGLNPTRNGILQVLTKMGANLEVKQVSQAGEAIGEITVRASSLKGVPIGGEIIANLIDELPILCIAAALAEGETIISNAEELRVKESDRLSAMYKVLDGLGVEVTEKPDGLIIQGNNGARLEPKQVEFEAGHDHRIAMTVKIASLRCKQNIFLNGAEWADISFPGFYRLISDLIC